MIARLSVECLSSCKPFTVKRARLEFVEHSGECVEFVDCPTMELYTHCHQVIFLPELHVFVDTFTR